MLLAEAEHFAGAPQWTWYILGYFFLAGLSGGSYVIATLLRLRGDPLDEPAARLGYYAAFPPLAVSPLLLALDLGQPWRFWHMLWNTTPGGMGLNFKYWSPMSVGAWALVVFGVFATVSFVDALMRDHVFGLRPLRLLSGGLGKLFSAVGAVFGLFVAGYTGVLLAVSNQAGWSDTWALGGLFLASGLTGSTALLMLLTRLRRPARETVSQLAVAERMYTLLELALIVVLAVTLIPAGSLGLVFGFPWTLLWLVALLGLAPGLGALPSTTLRAATPDGGDVAVPLARATVVAPVLVLVGVLALRAAVIFSVQ
jgi:polysulfide reductase chain C